LKKKVGVYICIYNNKKEEKGWLMQMNKSNMQQLCRDVVQMKWKFNKKNPCKQETKRFVKERKTKVTKEIRIYKRNGAGYCTVEAIHKRREKRKLRTIYACI